MDFVFQGFQSGLPVWVYLLVLAGTISLAWWSYYGIKSLKPSLKYSLITLRSLTFFILVVLLLNPFFKSTGVRYEKPNILVLLDNSASTGVKKGGYNGTDTYQQVLSDLNITNRSALNLRYFSVDADVNPSHPDSLTFEGSETNLFNAIEVISNNEQDAMAAILMSDGIFTKGQNPLFQSRQLEIPMYNIALGDTSNLKDLVVENVVTNATGYLNTSHPVEVNVINEGFGSEPFQVQLKAGEDILDSKTVTPNASTSSHTINFQLQLDEEGLRQYDVVIPGKVDEWTEVNNSHPFSVEVLDDKQSILSLAFEIHPDVRFIRSLLAADKNTQLSTRTWIRSTRFIEGGWNLSPDSLDLVVLHGYPRQGLNQTLHQQIEKLVTSVPAIILSTPDGNLRNVPQSRSLLSVSKSGVPSYLRVALNPQVESPEHPIMELPEVSYDRLPPVYAPIRNLSANPGSTVLFNSSYQGTATNQPLIAIQQVGNVRRAQLTGFGWYRIAQSTNPQAREFVESLFYNLVSWTASKPDDRRLKIQPTQKIFTGNQPVSFNAFLTNESGEVEPEGFITVTISGNQIESSIYNMENMGNGQYRLEIGALPEGIYQFEAEAKKGNRTIDTQEGEFSISSSNIEFVNTTRNDDLLRQMAEATGGKFYTYDNATSLWEDMDSQGLLDREEKVETKLFFPYQHAFWFILAIVLLGAEWFIRKYVALP